MVCKYPLVELPKSDLMECVVCKEKFIDNKRCINEHYICEKCRRAPTHAVIKNICLNTKSKDPVLLAIMMMNSPVVYMHASDHHSIVACALLTAYKNSGGEINLEKAIDEALERGATVPYGVCANFGTSGGAMSAGIFYSVLADTGPMSVDEWAQGNILVGACLTEIGQIGGPRCCKRCTFTALEVASQFSEEILDVRMEMPDKIHCEYLEKNEDCIEKRCPYYAKA